MIWVNDIIQGVMVGGLYALLGYGLAIVFRVMKIVNVTHGALAVVAAYLAAGLVAAAHLPVTIAIPLCVPVFALLGYVGQRTVLQASLNRGRATALLVTFALSIVIASGLKQFLPAGSQALEIDALTVDRFRIGSQISVSYLDLSFLVVAVIVLLVLQVLSATPQGRLIQAAADGPGVAEVSGRVFGIAGAVAMATVAIAGTSYGLYSVFDQTAASTQILLVLAFEAVVIGGLGPLWGILAGGILLGVVQQIGTQISPSDQLLAPQLFFLAMLVIRPEGVTGRRRIA